MAATLSISRTEADLLLGWVGNSPEVSSDVDLYDGGDDYEGNVFFGFAADVLPTALGVAQSLINSALIIATTTSGSFVKHLLTAEVTEVATHVGINDGHSSVQVVIWNVLLTD